MLKDKIKGMAAGLLAGIVIAGGTAMAAGRIQTVDVQTGVRIVIDGKELYPTDVNGNKVEAAIYQGTTYLPVRAIAEALGKAVYWDGPNWTAYLGNMDGQLEYPTLYMRDATNIAGTIGFSVVGAATDVYGQRYRNVLYGMGSVEGWKIEECLLSQRYSHFRGTLFIREGTTTEATTWIEVIADGKSVYTSPELGKYTRPVDFDVDIRGCNDFVIKIYSSSNSRMPGLYIADAGFYQ